MAERTTEMTCKRFVYIFMHTNPRDLRRIERKEWMDHYKKCTSCRDLVNAPDVAGDQRMSDLQTLARN